MQAISQVASTQTSARKKHSASLDLQVAHRLLDLPSTDDACRKRFTNDPREALAQVGFVNTAELDSPHFASGGSSWSARPRSPRRAMKSRGCSQAAYPSSHRNWMPDFTAIITASNKRQQG